MRGGVTDAGQQTTERTVKIELLSHWKLEAEFRKNANKHLMCMGAQHLRANMQNNENSRKKAKKAIAAILKD